MPKNNEKYWSDKLKKNKKRDCKNKLKLRKLGWRVFEIWECEIKKT
jgi:DNA mismatch endonuclease (patch repair protein)